MTRTTGCLLTFLVATTPAFGHHSFAMFDMEKDLTFRGTVVEYRWVNPHVHVLLRVESGPDVDPESVGTWDLEAAGSPLIMGRQGWTRQTLKVGDQLTVVVHPMKDGAKGASLFYVIFPDGKRLYTDIARPKPGS